MHSYALKFIMVGDSRVGKSQLTRAYTNKSFNYEAVTTVGMEFSTKTLEFEKCIIRAQLWDTAGHERFDSMTKAYFRDAVGAAVVFDITDRQTFLNVKTRWLKRLEDHGHEGMKVVLVGNKVDLTHEEGHAREVPIEEAVEFARAHNLDYIETSALTGFSVQTMFRRLIFSVAKLIPDVKNNLELMGLPEGWMIKLPSENEIIETRPRAASDDAATTIDTSTTVTSYATSKMTPSSLDSKLSKIDRRKSTILRVTYVNYWTAEAQSEVPTVAAPAGTLYTAVVVKKVEEPEPEPEPEPAVNNNCNNQNGIHDDITFPTSNTNKRVSRNASRPESLDSGKALTERSSSMKIDTVDLSESRRRRRPEPTVSKCSSCVIA